VLQISVKDIKKKFYVYRIEDPTRKYPPYYGKGTRYRIYEHWSEFKRVGKHPHNYKLTIMFRHLHKRGLEPKYKIIYETDSEEAAYHCEEFCTKYYGLNNLSNMFEGGYGTWSASGNPMYGKKRPDLSYRNVHFPPNKGKRHSEEIKLKISKSNLGQTRSEETKEKIGNASRGRKHTIESRKKMSKANKGQVPWNKGKKLSDETRKKMSEARQGSKNPMYGKKHTIETKKKISNRQKDYHRRSNVLQISLGGENG
jgi:hypothetical protein